MTKDIVSDPTQHVPEHPADVDGPVLVVDDSTSARAYHKAILVDAGFVVQEAGNGYEALELTLNQRFALLVVDVNMPVMDGYTLVEAVRTQSLVPDVPIIMISSEQEDVDSAEAYRRGANVYLVKPAAPEQLHLTARLLTGRAHGAAGSAGGRP